ncbi:uncharacterized protein LOC128230398 isoform X2 [Mya arenaria]|uniref:uncharacterized protein LOC128230398 isoform X2 n=1 Tax=Mya arenaria TaxID=6604 RepID=UPI0022E8C690|nr:uncharacterized protein LOC128230398 isoform X2 [Mya arenaria]
MEILKLPYIYVLIITLCYLKTTIQCVSTPERGRRSVCNTQALDVPNGNMGATFTCDHGFTRLGPPSIACMSGQWTPPPPLCVAPTCRKPLPRPHLRVRAEVGDALLKFSCDVNFRLNGAYQVTCNGFTWSEDIPRVEAADGVRIRGGGPVWVEPERRGPRGVDLAHWKNAHQEDRTRSRPHFRVTGNGWVLWQFTNYPLFRIFRNTRLTCVPWRCYTPLPVLRDFRFRQV